MFRRILALVPVAFLVSVLPPAWPADTVLSPAGNWKVLLPVPGEESGPSWIVKFEKKGDAWGGTVVATAEGVSTAALAGTKVDGETLQFTLKMPNFAMPIQVKLPTEKEPRMVGEATVRDKKSPVMLEPTKLTALNEFALAEEVLSRPENTRATYKAALVLISHAGERKSKPETIKAWAERAGLATEKMGKDQVEAMLGLASALVQLESGAPLAVGYANRAEALIPPEAPPIVRKRVLRVLAAALDRAGKTEEAKAVQARNDRIDPIRLQPYAGKGKGAVLVELFSSSQHSACVGPELACDALGKTYGGDTQVFVLNHHIHIPGADPLANPATEERERYYRPRSTPVLYLDGKAGPTGGGSVDDAQAKYDAYVGAINPLLEKGGARPGLTLRVTRKGEFIEVDAAVRDLATPGEDVRLRLALVEDGVELPGAGGLPRHASVVRDYFGTPAGMALTEKTVNKAFTIDVGDLRRRLRAYLEKFNETTPFRTRVWPTELKKLRVVGFIQNDRTRAVLAVVGAEVKPEE
jgi:hypothetical protein